MCLTPLRIGSRCAKIKPLVVTERLDLLNVRTPFGGQISEQAFLVFGTRCQTDDEERAQWQRAEKVHVPLLLESSRWH